MKAIFSQTVKRLFKLKNIIIYFSIVLLPVIIIAAVMGGGKSGISLEDQLSISTGVFVLIFFLWLAGIPFIVNVTANGTGLFSGEESEGTMGLLVMKPVKRYEIVLGKISGLFVSSIIYLATSVVLSVFLFYLISGYDIDVVDALLSLMPGLLLYTVFITLFFTALSGVMSVVFRKKAAGIVIMMLFVFMIFGIFPLMRGLLTTSGAYVTAHIYVIDFNYHFGSMFMAFISMLRSSPLTTSIASVIGTFTGTYSIENYDMDIAAISGYNTSVSAVSHIRPVLLTVIYILAAALMLWFVFVKISKKDIA